MKQFIIIIIVCLITASAAAQSWPGLTGKPDTSYNNGAAYRSVIKNYPDAKIVPELSSPLLEQTTDVAYHTITRGPGGRSLLINEYSPERKRKDKKRTAIIIIHGAAGGRATGHNIIPWPNIWPCLAMFVLLRNTGYLPRHCSRQQCLILKLQ